MTKRTFKRIQMLYQDGISSEIALTMIISLSKTATEAAQRILEFEFIVKEVKKDDLNPS